jgi:hypothetical protein
MIKRENRAAIEFGTVGLFQKTPVVWFELSVGRTRWSARLDRDLTTSQVEMPMLVWEAGRNVRGRD